MKSSNHLVAVYGSLRKGLHNHSLLENAKLLSTETTGNFRMYSMGGFPYIRPVESPYDITIEVYSVDDHEFANLDRLEGYPSFYDRKQIPTTQGNAWIYFIDEPPGGREEVTTGDWKQYYGANNDYSY